MTLSLRARLAAISTVVFGLLLAALSLLSYQSLARSLDADLTERLTQLTDGLHGYLRFDGSAVTLAVDPRDDEQASFVDEATRYYQIYDVSGRLLVESAGFAPLGLQLTPAEVTAYREQLGHFDIETTFARLRISNSTGVMPDGSAYLLQVGVSLEPLDATLLRYREQLLWRVPLALLAAVFASWWLSGFALRPLSRLAAAARHVDVATLDARLPVRGARDELDEVADAFNDTLARLEDAVGEMRQFSAALAHELRTPLAALRGEIELSLRARDLGEAQQRTFVSQIEEIDRLTRLIDHILTLARAESGQIRLTTERVDLGELAASLVEQLEPVAEARAIGLRCEPSAAVTVDGDRGWLQRLLLNLIDNAVKFTNANGEVVVRVSHDGNAARIDVTDTGIGLSPDDVQQVFQRFFRADRSRSSSPPGAGLGLSLVAWIAEQHRGAVSVQSRPGEGSTFTVKLPSARRV